MSTLELREKGIIFTFVNNLSIGIRYEDIVSIVDVDKNTISNEAGFTIRTKDAIEYSLLGKETWVLGRKESLIRHHGEYLRNYFGDELN